MRLNVWNLLSAFLGLATLVMVGYFGLVYLYPNAPINPFPPPTLPALVRLPTATLEPLPTEAPSPTLTLPSGPTATLVVVPLRQTLRPSSTPFPTPTFFYIGTLIPPYTPAPPTETPTPNITKTPAPYACGLAEQSPLNGTRMGTHYDFDAHWAIRNIGLNTLEASHTDIRYIRGYRMQTRQDIHYLSGDISKGELTEVTIDMRSPDEAGIYNTTWGLYYSGEVLCAWTMQITIKK